MKDLLICFAATAWMVGVMYALRRRRWTPDRATQELITRARREQRQGYRAWGATYPDAHLTETYGNGR